MNTNNQREWLLRTVEPHILEVLSGAFSDLQISDSEAFFQGIPRGNKDEKSCLILCPSYDFAKMILTYAHERGFKKTALELYQRTGRGKAISYKLVNIKLAGRKLAARAKVLKKNR